MPHTVICFLVITSPRLPEALSLPIVAEKFKALNFTPLLPNLNFIKDKCMIKSLDFDDPSLTGAKRELLLRGKKMETRGKCGCVYGCIHIT